MNGKNNYYWCNRYCKIH